MQSEGSGVVNSRFWRPRGCDVKTGEFEEDSESEAPLAVTANGSENSDSKLKTSLEIFQEMWQCDRLVL